MEYLSTRNNKLQKSFSEILFQGLSSDGGLFLPSFWPQIDIKSLRNKSYEQVALDIINPFVCREISKEISDYSKTSIDIRNYLEAEKKDIRIKRISRFIKYR